MSEYDRDFWEQRWSQALRAQRDQVPQRPPNAHLTAEIGDLRPGRVLDAGCGHGSDTFWLAARGWQVPAVDFARTALAHARSTAEAMGPDVAERIDWVEADHATWTPQRDEYDLVVCLYVHVTESVEEMVQRMATGVSCGGNGRAGAGLRRGRARRPRYGQWQPIVADERPRPRAGTGVDAVIRARRRS